MCVICDFFRVSVLISIRTVSRGKRYGICRGAAHSLRCCRNRNTLNMICIICTDKVCHSRTIIRCPGPVCELIIMICCSNLYRIKRCSRRRCISRSEVLATAVACPVLDVAGFSAGRILRGGVLLVVVNMAEWRIGNAYGGVDRYAGDLFV